MGPVSEANSKSWGISPPGGSARGGGNVLELAAQFDFLDEEGIASRAIFGALVWKVSLVGVGEFAGGSEGFVGGSEGLVDSHKNLQGQYRLDAIALI